MSPFPKRTSLCFNFFHQQSGPGHFLEVIKILPFLSSPEDETSPSFHIVALGLPGYGFSEGAKTKGFGIDKYAEVGHKLMLALGYNEYGGNRLVRRLPILTPFPKVAQGGDWGLAVS